MKHFLEEARRLIRINSTSANGNEEIANSVAGLFNDRGLKTQVQQVLHSQEGISKRQFNVIGILGDPLVDKKTRKGLLLNTHLDTVTPGIKENWTETGGDPFAATVKDGKIYGLGAADVKLDLLCKLKAVERFREKKLKMPIYVVGTCGEEVGMLGVKYLIKSLALNPKFVLVGEPTGLKAVFAHKCMGIYRVSIRYQLVERDAKGFTRRVDLHSMGRSAHSAYPHLGVNAIQQTVDFLTKASQGGFEFRFTKLDGGDSANKVPDQANAEFYLTSSQLEDFKRFYRETLKTPEVQRSFWVELGGLGETGVRFLPEVLFPCLSEVVEYFRGLAKEFEGTQDISYSPNYSTVNLSQLTQRSDGIDLMFDLRLLPALSLESVEKGIHAGLNTIANRYPSINLNIVRERMSPGLNMTEDHELVSICKESMKEAGIDPYFDRKSTATEAALYFQAGYQAVVFGPGHSQGNAHSPNEHNLLEHLEKAIAFYEKIIEKTCL